MDPHRPNDKASGLDTNKETVPFGAKIARYNQLAHEKLLQRADPLFEQMGEILISTKSVNERFNEISALRPLVENLCIDLKKQIHHTLLMSQSDQMLFGTVSQLNILLVKNYTSIVSDENTALFPNTKLIQKTLQFAMHAFKKIFTNYYKHHLKIPEGKWQKLNKLYVLGKHAKCLNKTLQLIPTWHNQFKTVKEMYLYCILFSLINPYKYSHHEIDLLSYAIEQWSGLLILKKNLPESEQQFYINLNDDLPPTSVLGRTHGLPRYINCDKLIQRLTSIIQANEKSVIPKFDKPLTEAESTLPSYILQGVLKTLTQREESANEICVAHYVNVITGLQNCFEQLCASENGDSLRQKQPKQKSLELSFNDTEQEENKPLTDNGSLLKKNHSCFMYATKHNQFKLKLMNPINTALSNDEVVCFKNPTSKIPTWVVGNIALILNSNNSIYLIIESISLEAFPVVITSETNGSLNEIVALLTVDRLDSTIQRSIMVPGTYFKVGEMMSMTYLGTPFSARAIKLLRSNPGYQLYEIDTFNEPDIFN